MVIYSFNCNYHSPSSGIKWYCLMSNYSSNLGQQISSSPFNKCLTIKNLVRGTFYLIMGMVLFISKIWHCWMAILVKWALTILSTIVKIRPCAKLCEQALLWVRHQMLKGFVSWEKIPDNRPRPEEWRHTSNGCWKPRKIFEDKFYSFPLTLVNAKRIFQVGLVPLKYEINVYFYAGSWKWLLGSLLHLLLEVISEEE